MLGETGDVSRNSQWCGEQPGQTSGDV